MRFIARLDIFGTQGLAVLSSSIAVATTSCIGDDDARPKDQLVGVRRSNLVF